MKSMAQRRVWQLWQHLFIRRGWFQAGNGLIHRGLLFVWVFWLTAGSAWSQLPGPTNTFNVTVTPTNGTIMINLTTNPVFVTIINYTNFTNITVVGSFGPMTNIAFLDAGANPDAAAGDGTFSANLIPPRVSDGTNMPLRLMIDGIDFTAPDPTNNMVSTNVTVIYGIVPRPANDNFTNAVKLGIAEGVILATNNYASLELEEPLHGQVPPVNASVWWTWSSPATTNVLIDLGGSDFDAVLAVYSGLNLSNLTEVASGTNDIVNNLRAHVNFNARAGATYRLAVSGYTSNEFGNIRLRIAPGALPDTVGPVVSITTPATESLFTTNLAVFTGTAKERRVNDSGVGRVLLQINDETNLVTANGTENWSAMLSLPPGTNLVRAIGVDNNGNRGPAAAIVVRYLNPTNDFLIDATELTDVAGVVTAINGRATKEPGEPLLAGNEGGHSIWFSWRAPSTGDLALSTEGSSFDTMLGLYVGSSVTNLVEIAANDDAFENSGFSAITHRVIGNQLYYIVVDGFGGDSGDVQLTFTLSTTEVLFSLLVTTPLGGSVSPAGGLFPENTNLLLTAIPEKNYEFVQWEETASPFVSPANPLNLLMNRNYSLAAIFKITKFSDTFRSGDLSVLAWTSGGNALWFVQNLGGQFVARSGPIVDRQSSSLIMTTNLFAGTGSFDLRISSEEGWDWLEFYLNGAQLGRWSGEVEWQTFRFAVPEGLNTLEWRYVKDANFSQGLDAAFLDNVYVPLERPDPNRNRARLSLAKLPTGEAQLTVIGLPDTAYVIQASQSFTNWVALATNTTIGVTLQFIDRDSHRYEQRFYRAYAP